METMTIRVKGQIISWLVLTNYYTARNQSAFHLKLYLLIVHERCGSDIKLIIFKLISRVHILCISCEIGLRRITEHLAHNQSILVQAMAWCRQETSHYMSQCWQRSLSPCGITRLQCVIISALLALCAGNSPVPVKSPHKGQWRRALIFSLICAWINDWVNNHEAGDSRRHHGHHDVNVMSKGKITAPVTHRVMVSGKFVIYLCN